MILKQFFKTSRRKTVHVFRTHDRHLTWFVGAWCEAAESRFPVDVFRQPLPCLQLLVRLISHLGSHSCLSSGIYFNDGS